MTACDIGALRASYLAAVLAGNRREALRLVIEDGVARGCSVRQVSDDVIRHAQREIGRLWQENRVTIAEEHMATAISQLALSHLYHQAQASKSLGKKVLVACVEGELHYFPARIAADALDLAGFDVRFLGANVPLPALVSMVKQDPPHLVCLSATMGFHVPALDAAVRAVREATNGRALVAVGGGACAWSRTAASDVRADFTASGADELVDEARRRLTGGER